MKELVPNSKKCYLSVGEKKLQYPQELSSWTKFFKRFRFFDKRYDHFIRIDIVANSLDSSIDHCLEWLGFVESKLFILLNNLARQ